MHSISRIIQQQLSDYILLIMNSQGPPKNEIRRIIRTNRRKGTKTINTPKIAQRGISKIFNVQIQRHPQQPELNRKAYLLARGVGEGALGPAHGKGPCPNPRRKYSRTGAHTDRLCGYTLGFSQRHFCMHCTVCFSCDVPELVVVLEELHLEVAALPIMLFVHAQRTVDCPTF